MGVCGCAGVRVREYEGVRVCGRAAGASSTRQTPPT